MHFFWVCSSKRPLEMTELRHVIVCLDDGPDYEEDLENHSLLMPWGLASVEDKRNRRAASFNRQAVCP